LHLAQLHLRADRRCSTGGCGGIAVRFDQLQRNLVIAETGHVQQYLLMGFKGDFGVGGHGLPGNIQQHRRIDHALDAGFDNLPFRQLDHVRQANGGGGGPEGI